MLVAVSDQPVLAHGAEAAQKGGTHVGQQRPQTGRGPAQGMAADGPFFSLRTHGSGGLQWEMGVNAGTWGGLIEVGGCKCGFNTGGCVGE